MGWFFDRGEEGPAEELPFIVRAGRRRKLNFGLGVTDYLLSPSLSGELELLYTTLAPGAKGGEPPLSYRGEQAGLVLAGSFELSIAQQAIPAPRRRQLQLQEHDARPLSQSGKCRDGGGLGLHPAQ